jgi:predicted RNA-binding protein with PIN domain
VGWLGRPFWRQAFWQQAGLTLGMVAGFLALGLGARVLMLAPPAAALGGADPGHRRAYPAPMEQPAPRPSLWLVDGFNVLCATLLGGRDREEWWTASRRAEVLALAERFEEPEAEIWVVFDGARDPGESPGQRVRRVFAASADDWLIEQVEARRSSASLTVVTADRRVADRARRRGAQVVSPGEFLARCG